MFFVSWLDRLRDHQSGEIRETKNDWWIIRALETKDLVKPEQPRLGIWMIFGYSVMKLNDVPSFEAEDIMQGFDGSYTYDWEQWYGSVGENRPHKLSGSPVGNGGFLLFNVQATLYRSSVSQTQLKGSTKLLYFRLLVEAALCAIYLDVKCESAIGMLFVTCLAIYWEVSFYQGGFQGQLALRLQSCSYTNISNSFFCGYWAFCSRCILYS